MIAAISFDGLRAKYEKNTPVFIFAAASCHGRPINRRQRRAPKIHTRQDCARAIHRYASSGNTAEIKPISASK